MAARKSFLLRLDGELLEELRRLADDDLRSLNGEIEYLLRSALSATKRRREQPQQKGEPGSEPGAGLD